MGRWVPIVAAGLGGFLVIAAGYELLQGDYARAARHAGVGVIGIVFAFVAKE
ncbi:MAG: hypothetical protein KY396_01665 [Actinobacteria bacterium]|nr:hypothetical protein [Actinomycetota bacterium]